MEPPNEEQTASFPSKSERSLYPANSIRCKHCNRLFATISAEDGLLPYMPPSQACAACEPFLGLYEALQIAEQAHTALLDRGPKHHGRTAAHYKLRNARVALENFLISVEAPNEVPFDVAQAGFANRAENAPLERINDLAEALQPETHQQSLNGDSPQAKHLPSVKALPSSKRKPTCNSRPNLERKRIKFTESVEERPEYRGMDEFLRSGKTYVPGRYVAAEGFEYLDTSGSSLTFAKFTGQKKVGSTFIDIVPKEEACKDKTGILVSKSRRKCDALEKQCDGGEVDAGLDSLESEEFELARERDRNQMSRKMLRNTRQPRSTTPPVTTRLRRRIAQCDRQNDNAQGVPHTKPSLIVVLKVSYPSKDIISADGRALNGASSPGGLERSSDEASQNEARREAVEATKINKFIINIQRELGHLQQATFTSRYAHAVSIAVRGVFEALEPLKHPPISKLSKPGEPEEVVEEGSIYFDAIDAADQATDRVIDKVTSIYIPHPVEGSRQREDELRWIGASNQSERVDDTNANRVSDINALGSMPVGVDQNTFDTTVLRQQEVTRKEFKNCQCYLAK